MNHKIALVTGASSGIGLAICHELAKLKYNLLLISNDEAGLKNAKAIIYAKHGINCIVYCEDLSKQEAAKNIVEFCTKNNLDIEVLINNAGILVFSEVAFAKDTDVSKILQLHINTPTFLCNYFSKEMVKNKKGYILNVSSISAVMPYPFISLYGPSKTYMRYFTRALRTELNSQNVFVTCLMPGATATALYDPSKVNIQLAKNLGVMHTPEYVASSAMNSLFKNQAICIPGIMNKIIIFIFPFIPNFIISLLYNYTSMFKKGEVSLS